MNENFVIDVGIGAEEPEFAEDLAGKAYITFELIGEEITIKFGCKTKNDPEIESALASQFGLLLHALSTGKLTEDIVNVLSEFGFVNGDTQDFVSAVFDSWQMGKEVMDAQDAYNTAPAVEPLRVWGASNFYKGNQ